MEQAQGSRMITFNYRGQMVSGKNQIKTAMVRGRLIMFPNSKFKHWRKDFQSQIFEQRFGKKLPLPFAGHVRLLVEYFPGDRRTRDMTGVLDAIFHAIDIKHGGCIINDDGLIKDAHIIERDLDRDNPRALLYFEAIP